MADASDRSVAVATIAGYAPVSLTDEVADFARRVVAAAKPVNPIRAKALLYAAGKLGTFATSCGLALKEEIVLHPSVIERFAVIEASTPSSATMRTLRSNLRFLAKEVVPNPPPSPIALPRERTKAPYSDAEIAAYLALARALTAATRNSP